MNAHAQLLGKVPLFHGLPERELLALVGRLSEKKLRARELLFAKHDTASSMYVVLSGGVRIFLPAPEPGAAPTVLRQLGPGEFFGEMALLDNQPRMASADAAADTVLAELTRESFVAELQGSGPALMAMLSVMSERLRSTTQLLESHTVRNLNVEADEQLTWAQRLADKVARWNGSWMFVLLLLGLTSVWIGVNALARFAFDAYPYQLFNLLLAVVVALQGPLIMMSQNRQMMKERLHSEADYLVNLKNETGIDQILHELAELRAQVALVKSRLELPPDRGVAGGPSQAG